MTSEIHSFEETRTFKEETVAEIMINGLPAGTKCGDVVPAVLLHIKCYSFPVACITCNCFITRLKILLRWREAKHRRVHRLLTSWLNRKEFLSSWGFYPSSYIEIALCLVSCVYMCVHTLGLLVIKENAVPDGQ